jgi:DNA polymerase-3 subunit gamma/tau
MRDLTRQYRPGTWDEIVGQDHLVKTLTNEITNKSVGPAYLFCGPRGTGKTTTARVFANALNAQIIELDAASNNGVEHIRDLRTDVLYQPTDGKDKKIYIIDEVN